MNQIDRIKQMDNILDRANECLNSIEPKSGLMDMDTDIKKLIAYYESLEWQKDYEDDENGKLPSDLKRGVLSQDAVYNFLSEYNQIMKTGEESEDCVFCHKERLVTDIIYEDDLVLAFMDMEPINEGHCLLVPKKHYLDADEVPDEILTHLMLVSKKIIGVLKEIYKPDGYSIMQNGGQFNDVGHYHMHIFPRYQGDGFGWTYGSEPKLVNSEIARKISEALKA